MKKLLVLAVATAGGILVAKKAKAAQHEQALWAEATDKVKRS
jgi:hypothetical protein